MNGYDEARARALRDRALDTIAALPGVTAVSYASRLPLSPDIMVTGVTLPGRRVRPQDQVLVDVVSVGPGYFDAVGVPIVRGRAFALADIAQRRQVAVVNEAMARTLWPGGDALGRRLQIEGQGSEPWEVIGVARNHKVRSVGEPPRPYMHLPEGQTRAIGLVVRTAGPADRLLPSLRKTVLALEPTIVFTEDAAASAIAETTMAPTRIGALVVGAFGVLALVLASVGLYGVIAYAVSRRTREIGVRLALGATRGDVLRLILSQGLRLAVVGVVLGTAGAVASGKLLASLLYGVRAWDPIALGLAATLLLLVALAANLVPARAASRTDPLRALRTE
jgi:predicted permease